MTQSNRKLLGIVFLLATLVFDAVLGVAIYSGLLLGQHPVLLIAFFAAAGLLWVFPAMWIIRWMARPDEA